jgi:hypothetical protein
MHSLASSHPKLADSFTNTLTNSNTPLFLRRKVCILVHQFVSNKNKTKLDLGKLFLFSIQTLVRAGLLFHGAAVASFHGAGCPAEQTRP